jgi:hypothetical protein
MEHFWEGFDKTAGVISQAWGNLGPVKRSRTIAATNSFKAKKLLGKGLLIGGAGIYGLHKITEPQKVEDSAPRQNAPVQQY